MADEAIAEGDVPDIVTPRAVSDVPQERRCLRCETSFCSEGFGERICRRCRGLMPGGTPRQSARAHLAAADPNSRAPTYSNLTGTSFRHASTSFTPRPTDTVTRCLSSRTG